MRITSPFSFYGGKSKIAHLYPEPSYPLIIEPFAGSAAYSWRYHDHEVWLNDLDELVCWIWEFLLRGDALQVVRDYIPPTIEVGTRVPNLAIPHPGLLGFMRAEANHGTQGARGVRDRVTKVGAKGWNRLRPKLEVLIPAISHWRITQFHYSALPNLEATWFIDPPYSNEAGTSYRECRIDYHHLGQWCRERKGQVIVCEGVGASWLPFEPLVQRRGFYSRYQKSVRTEAVYVSGTVN